MQNIPNIITSVRLVSAVLLAIFSTISYGRPVFLTLFIAAAVSDMLDGFIARKFNWCTEFGAKLDSVSDMTLYGAVFFCFLICLPNQMRQNAPLLCFAVTAQLMHWLYSVKKHGGFPAYHSTFSRVCAYAMFFLVLAFWQTQNALVMAAILMAWIACTIEGMIITAVLKRPMSNVSGIRAVMDLG